jgi:hypothetical protein
MPNPNQLRSMYPVIQMDEEYAHEPYHPVTLGPGSQSSPLPQRSDTPVPSPPQLSRHRTTMSPLATERRDDRSSLVQMRYLVDFIMRCNDSEITRIQTYCILNFSHYWAQGRFQNPALLCVHGVNRVEETCNECIRY